jgi:AP-1 complex subunit sigma 1/2
VTGMRDHSLLFLAGFVVVLQMQFMLLFSRQGKLRLQKWYVAHPDKLKKKITRELITTILARKPKMSSFLEWKDLKVVYKRYVGVVKFELTLIFCSHLNYLFA